MILLLCFIVFVWLGRYICGICGFVVFVSLCVGFVFNSDNCSFVVCFAI